MKKFTILWVLPALLMFSCASINSKKSLRRIEKVNIICPGAASDDQATSRKAVKKCRSKKVLMAVLYYHPDIGTRLEVAKMCKNWQMLKKARVFAKKAEPKNESQKEFHRKLLRLLSKKLRVNQTIAIDDLALANTFEEKVFSDKEVIEMEDFKQLVKIFLYYSDFKLKLLAIERIYTISTFVPQNMSYKKAIAKTEESKEDIRNIIKQFFPVFVKLEASSKRQINYKERLLTELQNIYDRLNPNPGQEAYINTNTFLRKVNTLRIENGLKPVSYSEHLNDAALEWAKYHYDEKLQNLEREHGKNSFSDKIADEGYNYHSSAANLSRIIIPNSKNIFMEWNDSSEEKDNMLREDFRKMGLACVYAPLKKKKAKYICVQLLADADDGE